MSLTLTIVGISLLIILHELGHFVAARLCGMRVLRFSLGFGPRLLERKFGETVWQLAAIPLGGFVQVHGMGPADESAPPEDERSYSRRPRWQRALFLFAGPGANWLLAASFIFLLASTVGFESYDESTPVVGQVLEGLPAAGAGLLPGDRVVRIGADTLTDWESLVTAVRANPGTQLQVVVQRGPQTVELVLTPRANPETGQGEVGVLPSSQTIRLGPLVAIGAGFRGAATITGQQVPFLWGFFTGKKEGRLSGLPGIVKMVSAEATRGLEYLLDALARLSITLFLLNLVPLPALDGSRLVFLGIETLRRRPLNPKIEGTIHGVGFLLLLGLISFVSIRDLF